MVDGRQDALLAQMRRGTLQYCVLALLASEERYGFDLVRGLGAVNGAEVVPEFVQQHMVEDVAA